MILKRIKYSRYAGDLREWRIEGREDGSEHNSYVYFGNINLLVGKNASGKSRTLDAIRTIADLVSGRKTVDQVTHGSETFDVTFEDGDNSYRYVLEYKEGEIGCEMLDLNGACMIDRKKGIFVDPKTSKSVATTVDKVKPMVALTDENGICYFPLVNIWGKMLRNFLFAGQSEKKNLIKDFNRLKDEDMDDIEDTGILVCTFDKGCKLYGKEYVDEVVSCMNYLGFGITDIEIQSYKSGFGICVEEEGYKVCQRDMSEGLYRALALFIQLVFAQMSGVPMCILIDDLGEGLDYHRSKELTSIMIKKINNSNIQFFTTTNDRYIMNQIPLKYWTVVDRQKKKSNFYCYENSREIYEDFRYTGLNNFDFLSTDFYLHGFEGNDSEPK